MKTICLTVTVALATLLFFGCHTVPPTPGVYAEFPGNGEQWSLMLEKDGSYSLMRAVSGPGLRFEGEKGRWTLADKKLRLQSDSGLVRTFSVQQKSLGWFHLVPDDKAFPVLVWQSEEANYE